MTRKSTKPNLRRNLDLRIGAYQFAVGSNITDNFHAVCRGVEEAVRQNIRLLVFPECALTGYPPRDIKSAADVNFEELNVAYQEIKNTICIFLLAQLQKSKINIITAQG